MYPGKFARSLSAACDSVARLLSNLSSVSSGMGNGGVRITLDALESRQLFSGHVRPLTPVARVTSTRALVMPAASAALTINNDIQTYATLADTAVTMAGKSELHITGTSNPISGSTIDLTTPTSWVFLEEIKPSAVLSTYLSQIRINGAAAVAGSNCRVVQYSDGAVIIPQGDTYAPMQVFTGPLFTGSSMSLNQYTPYTDGSLGVFANNISSFKLARGYSATISEFSNGTGTSQNYIAQDGDITVSLLPTGLDNAVSFIKVVPWQWVNKKGVSGNPGISKLNLNWWYNWDITDSSKPDLEYVPIRQHLDRPSLNQDWKARGSSQLLGFNEPDRPDQANLSVTDATVIWPELESTGLRLGAPGVSDGGPSWWLDPFMTQANNAGLRVDYMPIHYYQSHDPADSAGCASQMYNFLLGIWNKYKKPIWVTEWNQGANWTGNTPTAAQEAANIKAMQDMLEATPFVERYALYNWVGSTRQLVDGSGNLTAMGTVYRDKQSTIGYVQLTPDQATAAGAYYRFDGDATDSSGNGQSAILHAIAKFTPGQSGQALTLSGDATKNDYATLPSQIGDSTDFTFGGWVKWNGGANGQKIFELANNVTGAANKYLYLTPSSGSGVKFAIYNGTTQQELNFSTPIPVGTWTHVAVTISGNTGKLFINGSVVATNTGMSINPVDIGTAYGFLGKGRNAADPLFAGQMDDVQFLPYALTDAQVSAMRTNTAPAFAAQAINAANATRGVAYSGTLAGTATDANGDGLTYSKLSGPSWLTIATNGALSGTPPTTADGLQECVVRVTDANGATTTAALNIPMATFQGSSVWTSLTGQQWNSAVNWNGSFVADGANKTADFSTLDITADKLITLNGAHTIGNLIFGDSNGAQNWTLNNSNSSVLTLEGDTPSITVNQNIATISAPITGNEGFTKLGNGTLVLSGSNTYLGDTNIVRGIVNVQNGMGLGGNTTVNQAAGARNSGIQLQGNVTLTQYVTFYLSNDGGLQGTATVPYALDNVSGNNTITGLIYLTNGGGNSVIQSDSGALTLAGRIRPNPRGGARTLILQGASTDANTISGLLSNHTASTDVLSVVKNGPGTWYLTAANTYTGSTTLTAGRLDVGNDNALGNGVLLINGGALVPRTGTRTLDNAVTIGGDFALGAAGVANVINLTGATNLNAGVRIVNVVDSVGGTDASFSGVLTNGGLTKAGSGTLVLNASNTYTNSTGVTAGTLLLGADERISNSSSLILGGGTFATGGFSETMGSLSLADNSSIDFGAGASTLALSAAGTFASGKTLTLTNWTSGTDHLFIGNSATLTATQLAQINFVGTAARQLASGEVVPVVMAAPSDVTAVAMSATQINVAWTDNAQGEIGYRLERFTDAGLTVGLTTFNLPGDATAYADTSVTPGTTYYYRVTAVFAGGGIAGPVASPAVTTPAAGTAPTVTSFLVNNGDVQRSMVTSLTLVFSQPVHLGVGAIVLSGVNGDPATVSFVQTPANDASTYTLTFPAQVASSLADGSYQLKVKAALVTDAASNQTMTADDVRTVYRRFGDRDGNGAVDFNDFLRLQNAFGSVPGDAAYDEAFDSNGDLHIDFNDFLALQNNFGQFATV